MTEQIVKLKNGIVYKIIDKVTRPVIMEMPLPGTIGKSAPMPIVVTIYLGVLLEPTGIRHNGNSAAIRKGMHVINDIYYRSNGQITLISPDELDLHYESAIESVNF